MVTFIQWGFESSISGWVWTVVGTSEGKHWLPTWHWNTNPKGSCSTGPPFSLSEFVLTEPRPRLGHYVSLAASFLCLLAELQIAVRIVRWDYYQFSKITF